MTRSSPDIELLPCPFCGNQPHSHADDIQHNADDPPYAGQWLIECNACPVDCNTWGASKDLAIKYWNTRASQPATPDTSRTIAGVEHRFQPATPTTTKTETLWDDDSGKTTVILATPTGGEDIRGRARKAADAKNFYDPREAQDFEDDLVRKATSQSSADIERLSASNEQRGRDLVTVIAQRDAAERELRSRDPAQPSADSAAPTDGAEINLGLLRQLREAFDGDSIPHKNIALRKAYAACDKLLRSPDEAARAPEDKPGLLDTNPELFNILNHALGTMRYHRLMSALNWNGYQIVRDVAQPPAHPDVLMNVVNAKINDYIELHNRGDLTEHGEHAWLVMVNLRRDMELALGTAHSSTDQAGGK